MLLTFLTSLPAAKFKESIDVAVNLGVDPVNLIKWFVVLLYCQTAQVKQYVLLCLLKVLMLKRQKQPVQMLLVSTIGDQHSRRQFRL
jgi:hypothetical protein